MKRTIFTGLALLALAGPVLAQDAAQGQALFEKHCATCHGLEARGNGPMAPALTLQPTDLTGLAAGNGGAFPTIRVVKRIDGRDPLVSHGSPMPVFGSLFEELGHVAVKTPTGQPLLTNQSTADLVTWLLSIQE